MVVCACVVNPLYRRVISCRVAMVIVSIYWKWIVLVAHHMSFTMHHKGEYKLQCKEHNINGLGWRRMISEE